jgi:DNA mismatch repair protein MutL
VLSPDVFTRIAAGEVVERPASVVKELLENAIDAGARRIEVAVDRGGLERILVVDDGCGIVPEDLPLAFAPHATSKLSEPDDLFRVRTLGFRGEALASIGNVARVRLQSRPEGSEVGAEITCEGGKLGSVRPWNGSPGTRVEVRNLFFNTPVRRRFLRSVATEIGHIAEAVIRLALACPDLHLKLTHNDRLVYEVPRSAELVDRIGLFFGNEVRSALLEVKAEAGPARLTGYVADPSQDRGHPRMQYLFVNRRWVRDRALSHALLEAYHGLLMVGRYPVAFLFLELPPDLVDVNVHPTKSEVRFRDAQAVYHLVCGAVRDRLRQADLTPTLRTAATPAVVLTRPSFKPAAQPAAARPSLIRPETPEQKALDRPTRDQPSVDSSLSTSSSESVSDGASPLWTAVPTQAPRVIQMHNAYLVVETEEGMLVIDQHALHERILYEAWKERIRQGDLEVQQLLVPEPIDLTPELAGCALEHRQTLERLGLRIEEFGGNTVLLRSYPAMVRRTSPGELLRSAVEHLATHGVPPSPELLLDDLLKVMACKAAVKAGDSLAPEEVEALAAQRHLADDTHHCPHGRPTALLLSKHELDRQFRRT